MDSKTVSYLRYIVGAVFLAFVALNVLVFLDKKKDPRLTLVIPPEFCGEMAIYVAFDNTANPPPPYWERALVPRQGEKGLLAQLPFPDTGMHFSLLPVLGQDTVRIDRRSVGSWPYGAVHTILAGHDECERPSPLDVDEEIELQVSFEEQIEQGRKSSR